jgi:hypothetical protein
MGWEYWYWCVQHVTAVFRDGVTVPRQFGEEQAEAHLEEPISGRAVVGSCMLVADREASRSRSPVRWHNTEPKAVEKSLPVKR